MECEQLLDLIQYYMDGGLPQWRMRAVTRHLDDCPPCANGYRVELHYRAVVATKCREPLPSDLRQRVEAALGCVPPPGDTPLDGVADDITLGDARPFT